MQNEFFLNAEQWHDFLNNDLAGKYNYDKEFKRQLHLNQYSFNLVFPQLQKNQPLFLSYYSKYETELKKIKIGASGTLNPLNKYRPDPHYQMLMKQFCQIMASVNLYEYPFGVFYLLGMREEFGNQHIKTNDIFLKWEKKGLNVEDFLMQFFIKPPAPHITHGEFTQKWFNWYGLKNRKAPFEQSLSLIKRYKVPAYDEDKEFSKQTLEDKISYLNKIDKSPEIFELVCQWSDNSTKASFIKTCDKFLKNYDLKLYQEKQNKNVEKKSLIEIQNNFLVNFSIDVAHINLDGFMQISQSKLFSDHCIDGIIKLLPEKISGIVASHIYNSSGLVKDKMQVICNNHEQLNKVNQYLEVIHQAFPTLMSDYKKNYIEKPIKELKLLMNQSLEKVFFNLELEHNLSEKTTGKKHKL